MASRKACASSLRSAFLTWDRYVISSWMVNWSLGEVMVVLLLLLLLIGGGACNNADDGDW